MPSRKKAVSSLGTRDAAGRARTTAPASRARRAAQDPASRAVAVGGSRLYGGLAAWWPVLSAPEDYREEARFYARTLVANARRPVRAILELGCGGGNNATHLKARYRLTLVDISGRMLALSRRLNPRCEHIRADMRAMRLGRRFDAVFVHDAIMYMTTERALLAAIRTAEAHLEPGGAALFAPDHVKETFEEAVRSGGNDAPPRSARYLEWTWDPDPSDTTYLSDFVYLLRDGRGTVRCEHDRHRLGLFPRATWIRLIAKAGLRPKRIPYRNRSIEPGSGDLYLGLKPVDGARRRS